MSTFLWIALSIAIFFIIIWLYYTIKSVKDPDVVTANKLGISIRHYHKYMEIQTKIECLCKKGIKEGEEINSLMKQIPNMNEWYRFNEYQYQLSRDRWKQELENISNPT